MGKQPPKKGKICPGSHKEWVPEASEACGSLPALLFQCSDSLDSRPGRGRRRLRLRLRRGGRCCTLPGCVRKGRAGRKAHPLPRRGHTWALQAGRGAGRRLAPASLGCLPAPPRGGRQMGRPPAQQSRQETAAWAAWNAAAGSRGGALTGSAHRRGGEGPHGCV